MTDTTTIQTTKDNGKDIVAQQVKNLPATEQRELHLQPAVDILEDATGFSLYADLPGVDKDGLTVRVEGDTLAIEGKSKLELPKGARPIYAEQRALNFRRRFTLSSDLETAKIEAKLANGVLMVRIPKAAAAQPRKIEVKVG